MFGEVLVNVMVDFKILFSGIFYELYIFWNFNEIVCELFGFYVYRKNGGFYVFDLVGFDRYYIFELWYWEMKYWCNMNIEFLKIYNIWLMMCLDINGLSSVWYEYFFVIYRVLIIE